MPARFFFQDDSSGLELAEDFPWSETGWKTWLASSRAGWRCAAQISPSNRDAVSAFIASLEGKSVWGSGGESVHVSAQLVPSKNAEWNDPVLLIELWSELSANTPESMRRCEAALEKISEEISASLDMSPTFSRWSLQTYQEFLEIKLPRRIARSMNAERARGIILSRRTPKKTEFGRPPLPTLALRGRQLRFGPEQPGTIKAVQGYLAEETPYQSPYAADRHSGQSWIPTLMVAAMLLTWQLPLTVWSVGLIFVVLTLLMALASIPAFRFGWRQWVERASATTSIGFFGIGLFGVGYALCALASDDELGHVDRLGYAFLVSTGLGIAGGVLGDNPKGTARILAHIQLFLFLGGLAGLVAMILRIDRRPGPRE